MESPTFETRPQRVALGALFIVFAVFLMAVQDAAIKLASSEITLWQLYVLRGLFAVPLLLAIAWFKGTAAASLARAFGTWPLLRAGLLVLMYISIYAALPVLPLAVVAGGMYTSPLFIALFSALLIGEPVRPAGWGAVLLGTLGVMLILKPGADAFTPVALLPVLAGVFYALAAILTRSRCHTQSPLSLALSLNMALLATGLMASLGVLLWQPGAAETAVSPFLLSAWAELQGEDWALIALLAVLIVGIGVGLAAAYQVAPPTVVATFDFSYLLFATLLGYALFSEIPDQLTVAGMVLIAGAGLIVMTGAKPERAKDARFQAKLPSRP